MPRPIDPKGGDCGRRSPPKQIARKLRFLVREIAVGTKKNFGFPDSVQGKGRQKNYKSKQSQNPAEKMFHVFGVILKKKLGSKKACVKIFFKSLRWCGVP